jgi:5-methylcytosine-specific restriction endonuclease McrA
LEADHIKPWAHYSSLRYAVNNGRTLCRSCHIKTFRVKECLND